jgi:phosphatidylglycerophosphate synthase
MPKLSEKDRFIDFSDYGRPAAQFIVRKLIHTKISAIDYTIAFGIVGLVAIYCIYNSYFYLAAPLLILKSILDAADGEVARVKKTPSYTGRYLDSIFDIILNFILLAVIAHITLTPYWVSFLAFVCIQIQGTLYNFYYVILRNKSEGGDQTSKVFEKKAPRAFPQESQKTVNFLFGLFTLLYGVFDRFVYSLDRKASKSDRFPNWFMSALSFYGLGFQLLAVAVFLVLDLPYYIIPYFITSSIAFPFFILVRKIKY